MVVHVDDSTGDRWQYAALIFDLSEMEPPAMHTSAQRYQRIRTTALSIGMVLGMAVTTLGPQAAHAAVTKATKPTKASLREKITPLPEATSEQLIAAERVLMGGYECEFGKHVSVDPHKTDKGYFTLKLGKQGLLDAQVFKDCFDHQSTTGQVAEACGPAHRFQDPVRLIL